MKNRILIVLAVVSALLMPLVFVGCGSDSGNQGGQSGISGDSGNQVENQDTAGEIFKIEAEGQTAVTSKDGVKVDFSGLFEGGEELTIKKVNPQPVDSDVEIYAYDFALFTGQPGGVIEIVIPYDDSGLGEEEHLSVCGKYLNEQSGEWEDVYYYLNTEENTVSIFTDHLSTYSAFKIKNPGKRSEYISEVNEHAVYIGTKKAEEILKIYAAKSPNWLEDMVGSYLGATGTYDFYLTSNLPTLISLGGLYDDVITKSFQDGMTNFGIGTAALRFAFDAYSHGITSDQAFDSALDLLANVMVSKASASLQLAYVTVGVADMVIDDVKTYAIETKYESTKNMYDAYYRRPENKRNAKQWRLIFEDIYRANPSNPEVVVDKMKKEIDAYVNKFWEVAATDWDSWIDAYDENATLAKYPWPTREDQIHISNNHKSELNDYLQPVLRLISRDMYFDCMQKRREDYEKWSAVLNKVYTVNITEDYGDAPKWANAYVTLAPLTNDTTREDWTVRLGEKGNGWIKFTMRAHITAGLPKVLEFYKSEEDFRAGNVAHTETIGAFAQETQEVVVRTKAKFVDLSGVYRGVATNTETGKVVDNTKVEIKLIEQRDGGADYEYSVRVYASLNEDFQFFVDSATGVADSQHWDWVFSEDGQSFTAKYVAPGMPPWVLECQKSE